MQKFYRMRTGNITEDQIEIYDKMYTEELEKLSVSGNPIVLEKTPKLFYKPENGIKTDLVRGSAGFPVVSEKLKKIIEDSNDKNLEFASVQLISLGKDEIDLNNSYFFMNILNRVECFDFEKSVYKTAEGFPNIVTRIETLILDENKIGDRKIFRIRQSPAIIFVSEDIKENIEKSKLLGVEVTLNYL
jgi:hypothetical protein